MWSAGSRWSHPRPGRPDGRTPEFCHWWSLSWDRERLSGSLWFVPEVAPTCVGITVVDWLTYMQLGKKCLSGWLQNQEEPSTHQLRCYSLKAWVSLYTFSERSWDSSRTYYRNHTWHYPMSNPQQTTCTLIIIITNCNWAPWVNLFSGILLYLLGASNGVVCKVVYQAADMKFTHKTDCHQHNKLLYCWRHEWGPNWRQTEKGNHLKN